MDIKKCIVCGFVATVIVSNTAYCDDHCHHEPHIEEDLTPRVVDVSGTVASTVTGGIFS